MLRPLLPFLACFLFATSALSQTCSDTRTFDFKNATIQTGTKDENHYINSTLNGPEDGPETFQLTNGSGFQGDDLEPHEWGITLVSDHLLHPDPSTWLRVLVMERDHLTGTGTFYFVLAFACAGGRVMRIFQFSGEGVELKQWSDRSLEIALAIWAPNDAHADPSLHRELFYRWDAKLHRYRLVRKTKISR